MFLYLNLCFLSFLLYIICNSSFIIYRELHSICCGNMSSVIFDTLSTIITMRGMLNGGEGNIIEAEKYQSGSLISVILCSPSIRINLNGNSERISTADSKFSKQGTKDLKLDKRAGGGRGWKEVELLNNI